MTPAARYWLRFQLVMAAVGAGLWCAGALVGSEFTSGLGVGVLASALALRVLRRRADREI
jgi:F0F1-type ATP synthase membrane subunit c/vacuolar-type H+-ATPase subunit K